MTETIRRYSFTMTKQQVIEAMPPDEREGVASRLEAAEARGWSPDNFCVWECWQKDGKGGHKPLPADKDDIFGFPPGSKHVKPVPQCPKGSCRPYQSI